MHVQPHVLAGVQRRKAELQRRAAPEVQAGRCSGAAGRAQRIVDAIRAHSSASAAVAREWAGRRTSRREPVVERRVGVAEHEEVLAGEIEPLVEQRKRFADGRGVRQQVPASSDSIASQRCRLLDRDARLPSPSLSYERRLSAQKADQRQNQASARRRTSGHATTPEDRSQSSANHALQSPDTKRSIKGWGVIFRSNPGPSPAGIRGISLRRPARS